MPAKNRQMTNRTAALINSNTNGWCHQQGNVSSLQFFSSETTAISHSKVVSGSRWSDNGTEQRQGSGSNGGSFGLASVFSLLSLGRVAEADLDTFLPVFSEL